MQSATHWGSPDSWRAGESKSGEILAEKKCHFFVLFLNTTAGKKLQKSDWFQKVVFFVVQNFAQNHAQRIALISSSLGTPICWGVWPHLVMFFSMQVKICDNIFFSCTFQTSFFFIFSTCHLLQLTRPEVIGNPTINHDKN